MPPFVSRKRHRSPSPSSATPPKRTPHAQRGRRSVFETLDDEPKSARTPDENKSLLDVLGGSEDESSVSELDSDQFEAALPAPTPKRRKLDNSKGKRGIEPGEESSDEEIEWEDAVPTRAQHQQSEARPSASAALQDLEITIQQHDGPTYDRSAAHAAVGKKGPSKIERNIRIQAHMMHVQFLVWHNALRNRWVNDEEVQKILLEGLSDGIKAEVRKYRNAMGIVGKEERSPKNGKVKGKGKAKQKPAQEKIRDWGADAGKIENGIPNLSRGDPLIRLLKYLSAYWRKRFRITSPALRKQGYRPPRELDTEIKSFQNDPHDASIHGERIESLAEFRTLAKKCEGSRDVGAQLFTALLRGLRIEARMIASLQPIGFGWTKHEEAKPREKAESANPSSNSVIEDDVQLSSSDEPVAPKKKPLPKKRSHSPVRRAAIKTRPMTAASQRSRRGTTSAPISLHDSSSELSDPPSSNSDTDASIIDITPARPSPQKPSKSFDKDLTFPTYWSEVFSPVSNTWIPVSVLVNPIIATQPEHLAVFEPKGAAAEKARQVLCYVIAYSADKTAKDVTIRYLRKHIWPGKTKGFRIPPEKVPVYNKRGKILRHEEYDWFKRVMSPFDRPSSRRTAADDVEEQSDLVPVMPERKSKDGQGAEETLSGYKNSAEFVLERFLRREEALLPGAKPVRHFKTKVKGEEKEEPVYLRSDVVACKTVETWHKEGRQIKIGERPLKHVPYRAVTLIRKREIEEAARQNGEKPLQGLYSEDQTEWIVPDPIGPDGKIPKNAFGNIDVYVPSMIPEGAVHIPLKGTAKICKRLGIEFAEACTGFEFGKQRAVPVLTGVVVARGNEDAVIDAWEEDRERQRVKDEAKYEALVLGLWKKFYTGLKIRERVMREYPEEFGGERNGQENGEPAGDKAADFILRDEAMAGGFFLPGHDEEEVSGGGFLPETEDEEDQAPAELVIEHSVDGVNEPEPKTRPKRPHDTPISFQLTGNGVKDDESSSELSELDSDESDEESEENYIPKPTKSRGRSKATTTAQNAATTKAQPRWSAATSSPYFKKR